jgi:hypothetical protein
MHRKIARKPAYLACGFQTRERSIILRAKVKPERGTAGPTRGDCLEFVILGAHLDSWDLGQGTTDNGTGTCVVLEAARILARAASSRSAGFASRRRRRVSVHIPSRPRPAPPNEIVRECGLSTGHC